MPKQVSQDELLPIIRVVEGFYAPVSFDEIAERMPFSIAKRTLQRRLASLVKSEQITAISNRGGRRYVAKQISYLADDQTKETSSQLREEPSVVPVSLNEIALSAGAQEIKRSISRPMSARRPVGYQSSFLENYRPNVTAYLPDSLRRKLSELGKTEGGLLPAGMYFRKVMNRLLIDLSWNSSRLEGNTYSLLETQRLLEIGEISDGKAVEETQMILNHKAAIELLADQADEIGFNRYTVCNLHAILSDNLLPDPAACGRLRSHAVGISGTVFRPLAVPQMVEDRFDQILATADAIKDAFEQSFFAMVHLPYLQPFEDVNKRVSRLVANIPLVQRNLSPLSFVDVPRADYVNGIIGVYELNRVDYLRDVFAWAYERSCARYSEVRQSLGEPDAFRLRHRELLADVIAEVVRGGMDKKAAVSCIRRYTGKLLSEEDRQHFFTMAETELSSLHEGNFARYRLRPTEFSNWKKNWK